MTTAVTTSPGRLSGVRGETRAVLVRLLWISLFALAFAWMESATVTYLRLEAGGLDPLDPSPGLEGWLTRTEVIREIATMLLMMAAGALAGRTFAERFGYSIFVFGVWDILYYVFLAAIGPWPRSLTEWDLLFLIPLPWWGPIWSPMAIAVLLIVTGIALVLRSNEAGESVWPSRQAFIATGIGCILSLSVFMEDAIRHFAEGGATPASFGALRPGGPFLWLPFALSLLLLATPAFELVRGFRRRR